MTSSVAFDVVFSRTSVDPGKDAEQEWTLPQYVDDLWSKNDGALFVREPRFGMRGVQRKHEATHLVPVDDLSVGCPKRISDSKLV